ncbi:MAG: hypothetical protein II433_09940 [Acidaminococcaceae bacterium]|nr:hypothetical protein [Acidaminococcaceae bacterium]
MNFTVKTDITADLAKVLSNATDRAAHAVAVQVEKDTSPFVPFLTGSLDTRTKVEGNTIIYPGPYARFLYYGKLMVDPDTGSAWARKGKTKVVTDRDLVFTTDFHSQAGAFWFERSKAQNLPKWLRVAQKAVNKYGE